MSEIIDVEIKPFLLAREINTSGAVPELDAQVEAGKKLIRIRQYLQMKNGRASGRPGSDGFCPLGWREFMKAHLLISPHQVSDLIRYAVDPSGERARLKAKNFLTNKSWVKTKATFKAAFKHDPEGAEEFVRFCIERISEHERERTQSPA